MSLGAHTAAVTGVVTHFDAEVGLGVLEADDGTELGFHCTQIADGTRRIAAGTAVRFILRAGRGGRWEAGAVAALVPSSSLGPARTGAAPAR